jgi:hypothetical protein
MSIPILINFKTMKFKALQYAFHMKTLWFVLLELMKLDNLFPV